MKYLICFLLLLLLPNVLSDNSASFCLCALKTVLKDYALMTTDRIPPRYRSSNKNDIGFYVVPSKWKAVNDATWSELGAMINAPTGMYTHISLDGINPINDGLALDSRRSSHLADIMTEYRLMMNNVDIYHENIIKNRTKTCEVQEKKSIIGFDLKNTWKQFFAPRAN
jgi:hypothetical protein